jgi:hypothetical protein
LLGSLGASGAVGASGAFGAFAFGFDLGLNFADEKERGTTGFNIEIGGWGEVQEQKLISHVGEMRGRKGSEGQTLG